MSNPTPKNRRHKKPSESKVGLFHDSRVHIAAVLVFLTVVTPTVVLYFGGAFDGLFAARVNQESYEQLKVGMSEHDLRALMGSPTSFDRSAIPRVTGAARRFASAANAYPLRFIWRDEQDVIWADVVKKRVVKFGATLDGEQYGADPDTSKLGQPERPKSEEPQGND